ncbi:MAG: NosD domain-containing protein, partial [Saprospiraceae bacterium]
MDQNTSISIPFDVDVSGDPNSTINLDLEPYNFTYTHPIGAPPITDLLIWGTFTPDNPEPTNGEGLEFYMDNISVTSSCNSQIQITHTVKSQCIGGQAVIEYEVCLLGPGTAPVTVNLQADIPQGLTVVSGGGFDPNGLATFQLTPGTECNGGPNTYIITLTMNVSPNFDPAQAPIPVGVPLEFVGTGLCIDPATGHGGDVTLMLQDCLPAAACFCPPNTGPPPIGNNMDSETTFSTSGLPSTLENSCLSVNGRLYVDKNFTIKNTHVIMNRGAEIVVKDKAKLEVTDFSILEGCEHMWRGITVENGGILAMTDNSQVLDAQWAIQAMSGSTIEVTDCYFDRDYAGIHVPVSANGAAQTVNVVAITGNQFATWSALKPAYTVTGDSDHEQDPIPGVYTYTGISLNDVVGFDIGAGNKFDEVRNAVFALRSGFTMEHCTIRNLVADPADLNGNPYFNVDQHGVYADYCPLAKVTYCSFLNFGKGIFSQASNITADFNTMAGFNFDSPEDDMGIQCELNTNKSVRVRNNTISAWGTGIYVSNALPATILRIKGNILTMYPGSPGQHIDMQSIRWGLVAGNTMTRSHASATGFGISMLSCSSITVEGNDMFGLQRGTSTQGCVGNIFTVNDAVDGGL